MKKLPLEKKVDLLLEVFDKLINASHKHNEAFRDAILRLTDAVHARKREDEKTVAMMGKLLALYTGHSKVVEETVEAIANDVVTFDRNLNTMNANVEQRFNAMHLEHDLIIDMLSRIHGITEKPKAK